MLVFFELLTASELSEENFPGVLAPDEYNGIGVPNPSQVLYLKRVLRHILQKSDGVAKTPAMRQQSLVAMPLALQVQRKFSLVRVQWKRKRRSSCT